MCPRSDRCLLAACVLLAASAGCAHRRVALDSSARLEERRERSVTEDPAVRGETPDGWLVPPLPAAPPNASPGAHEDDPHDEIAEFVVRFGNTKPPQIFQGDLAPGATRAVAMQLTGPSGLDGSVQWMGTAAPLKVTIAVNASPLATGTPYRLGSSRGGCYLTAHTPVGGRATMAVTNTSSVNVTLRLMLVATAR